MGSVRNLVNMKRQPSSCMRGGPFTFSSDTILLRQPCHFGVDAEDCSLIESTVVAASGHGCSVVYSLCVAVFPQDRCVGCSRLGRRRRADSPPHHGGAHIQNHRDYVPSPPQVHDRYGLGCFRNLIWRLHDEKRWTNRHLRRVQKRCEYFSGWTKCSRADRWPW